MSSFAEYPLRPMSIRIPFYIGITDIIYMRPALTRVRFLVDSRRMEAF